MTFERGTGVWEGVVMVERPDMAKLPQGAEAEAVCRVMSARTVQLGGRRAICTMLPYDMVKEYFRVDDGDHVFLEAELKDEFLKLYGHARTNMKEWIIFSMTAGQAGGGVHTGYT